MRTEEGRKSFSDGCHRYGWLITIIVNLMALAYFAGGVSKTLEAQDQRIKLIEEYVFHSTRGGELSK